MPNTCLNPVGPPPAARPAGPGRHLPGLAWSGALAAAAVALGRNPWLQAHGLGALTLAIAFGLLAGNTVYPRWAARAGTGVNFSRQTLLRAGVVLYGLRLTLQDLGRVGLAGVAVDALVLGSTFALACLVGRHLLRMDRNTVMLIGAGSSICGAAAVMATEPVLRARPGQVTVAVATVVVFGTLAMLLYPLLFELNRSLHVVPGGARGFGLYIGSTVHEVAQVVAAANAADPAAADSAVIAKLVRVMMLAPFLVGLSAWLARTRRQDAGAARPARPGLPGFAFAFLGVVGLHSLAPLPLAALALGNDIDTGLLAMAMAALGLATHVSAIRQAGARPLLLAAVLSVWLVAGGALINRWVPALLG